MKRFLLSIFVEILFCFQLIAQSHHDYMDDDAVAGGAGRALNGIVFFILFVVLAFFIILLLGGLQKIYYWFNPQESTEYKARIQKKEEKVRQEIIPKIQEQKQTVVQKEKLKSKEAVDLGLSVLWADTNLYADAINEKGTKYIWGDIEKRSTFRIIDCKLRSHSDYELKRLLGNEDMNICGNEKYDAASCLWGENWRLPQRHEFTELIEKCDWIWTTIKGINGYKIIGKNGNSIFLPVTGVSTENETTSPTAGFYWSGTASDDILGDEAYYLFFDEDNNILKKEGKRWKGMAIRPVWSSQKEIIEKDGFTMSSFGSKLTKAADIEDCHIPDGVKIISKNAFKDAKNIKHLYIPNSVEEVEESAFSNLNIESVYIPQSVSKWGESAFAYCYKLKNVTIEEGIPRLGKSFFFCCSSIESISLPDSIEILLDGIFSGCNNLKKIKLPKSLTYLGESAFSMCESLCSIELPSTLIGICNNTFTYCTKLKEVIIPEGVVAIGEGAFSECMSLTKFRIPTTLQYLDPEAFYGYYEITAEVPKGKSNYYKKLNIAAFTKFVEYEATMPNNIEELKEKSNTFMLIQKSKREREDYEERREAGNLTREERAIEDSMYWQAKEDMDYMNDLDFLNDDF